MESRGSASATKMGFKKDFLLRILRVLLLLVMVLLYVVYVDMVFFALLFINYYS